MAAGSLDAGDGGEADARELVADVRDEAADARDLVAAARDDVAGDRDDAAEVREAQLNRWQEELEVRARRWGFGAEQVPSAASGGVEAGTARTRAGEELARVSDERDVVRAEREAATQLRADAGGSAMLALAFASIAEELHAADSYEEVMTRVAQAAVATVAGAEGATVTLANGGSYQTAGVSDLTIGDVDQVPEERGAGSSHDGLAVPLDGPALPDRLWRAFGARPSGDGVGSSLSYRLDTSIGDGAPGGEGSLDIYSSTAGAFDEAAREVGFVLAVHAALAAREVGERTTLRSLNVQLERALQTRDVIGQAKGILMERLKITPDEAFDLLKDCSQQLNVKVREIALQLSETGEVPQRK